VVDTRSAAGERDGAGIPRRVWTGVRGNDAAPPSMDLNPKLISAGQDLNSNPFETTERKQKTKRKCESIMSLRLGIRCGKVEGRWMS